MSFVMICAGSYNGVPCTNRTKYASGTLCSTHLERARRGKTADDGKGLRGQTKLPKKTNTPSQNERYQLKHHYGITPCEVTRLRVEQGDLCALCSKTWSDNSRGKLCVDHDHNTGRIRGLLCVRCNTALGALGDDIPGLIKALDYLKGTQHA